MSRDEIHTDEITPPKSQDIDISHNSSVVSKTLQANRPKSFRNRFLDFVRISSVLNSAAGRFFKSRDKRRFSVMDVLLAFTRVGYFNHLPGFNKRLIHQDYLSFVSGSVGQLAKLFKQNGRKNTKHLKPEKATIVYLTKIQVSTRFWGSFRWMNGVKEQKLRVILTRWRKNITHEARLRNPVP